MSTVYVIIDVRGGIPNLRALKAFNSWDDAVEACTPGEVVLAVELPE